MKAYKYIVSLAAALAVCSAVEAQEVVSNDMIYDRITEFIEAEGDNPQHRVTTKNIQTIRYEHDLRLTYGAIGLSSWLLLSQNFGYYDLPMDLPMWLDELRTKSSPRYTLATFGLSYGKQYKPWLTLGCKTTFACDWQRIYDTVTDEYLYSNNCYNAAMLLDARFSWLRREKVELYSSFALGILAHIERANSGFVPMADAALIGINVGRSVYGFAEIGGGIGGSVRVGIGYRFNTKK